MKPIFSRVSRTYREAADAYDRMSRYYNYISGPAESRLRQIGLDLLDVNTGENVLEIGFGTGTSFPKISQKAGEKAIVAGVDISRGMCQVTSTHLQTQQLTTQILVIQGNALWCPFKPKIFDAIFMSFTLELFDTPDIPLVLKECSRILNTAGRIGIISLSKTYPEPRIPTIYEQMHNRFPKFLDCRPIPVRDLLHESGMNILKHETRTLFGLPVDIVVANWQ